MITDGRRWLIAAGAMSAVASLAHVACIIGGPEWYIFLGAPRRFAYAAGNGDLRPVAITLALSAIIMGWSIYAFSAAKIIRKLPLTRLALVLTSAALLLRGLSYFVAPWWAGWRPDLSSTFMFWSSSITLVMGLCFAIGTWQAWPSLNRRETV